MCSNHANYRALKYLMRLKESLQNNREKVKLLYAVKKMLLYTHFLQYGMDCGSYNILAIQQG